MERNDLTVTGNIPTSNIIIPEDIITKLRDEIIENLKSLFEKELSGIKDFYISELAKRDNSIYKLQTRIGELQRRVALAEIFCDKQKIDIDDNEQYSRRHSLRLYGIEKRKFNETADDVLNKIYDEMDRVESPIDEVEVDRAHRTGKAYKDSKGKWQQPVLLKFVSWKARNEMFRSRKQSRFYMKADLTNRKEEILMYAREQINDEGSLANRLINYVYVDPNCTLMAFTSTGRFLRFNSKEEFEALLLYMENTTRLSERIYATIEQEWGNAGE